MLLGDSNVPGTTHTTPVVVRDIALQLRLQLFVAALGHSRNWGYLKMGKKRQISFCEQEKAKQARIKNRLYGQTSQMVDNY